MKSVVSRVLSLIVSLGIIVCMISGCSQKSSTEKDSSSSQAVSDSQVDSNPAADNGDADSTPENNNSTSAFRIVRKPYTYHPEYFVNQAEAGSATYIWVYNANNQVIGSYSLGDSTSLGTVERFEYNDEGYASKKLYSRGANGKEMIYNYDYEYTADNQISTLTVTYTGDDRGELKSGDISQMIYSYSDGVLEETTNNTIRNGSVIKTRHDFYTFDENGNLTRQSWYYEESPEWKYYFSYEYSNNKMTKGYYGISSEGGSDASGDSVQNTYIFDENEDITHLGFGGTGQYDIDYEYDSNGSLIKMNDATFHDEDLKVDETGKLITK